MFTGRGSHRAPRKIQPAVVQTEERLSEVPEGTAGQRPPEEVAAGTANGYPGGPFV